MVQDEESEQTPKTTPPVGRALVFGGVAAACALGAGLGLWARPVNGESPQVAKPLPPVAEVLPDRRLRVVLDEGPPPVAKPLEVLSPPPQHAAAPIAPEPQVPRRPPEGLVRIDAPDPGPLALAPRPQPVRVIATPKPAPVVVKAVAKAEPAPKRAHKAIDERDLRTARAEHVRSAPKHERPKLAKAEPRPARSRPHEVETADAAHEARARRAILALAHVVTRIAAHHAREEARAEPPPAPARKASLHEARVTRTPAKKPPRRERYIPPLNTRDAGPIRVATVTTRCASPDPGAALTCGDPALGAAERRMNRAYRDAVAAGVPAATLEQQQQRWLSARAAAAREAPWAVREVYQARIAELQDMTRSAEGN